MTSSSHIGAAGVAAFLVAASLMRPAAAYTLDSAVGDPCHERLASEALAIARTYVDTAPVMSPATEDDQALIDDLPFAIDTTTDLALASLLLGARDNDLKGSGAQELDSLAGIHGDAALQREHCLRRPEHDGETGSADALDDCRGFLRERFAAALLGLDANGIPDPNVRAVVPVKLAIRGEVDVSVPAFWLEMGRALHTMQDGFTHTYRTPDGIRVTAVLNWVDVVDKQFEEARDGPPHSMELDRCDDPDALRLRRRELATDASVALLVAALRPGASTSAKQAEADVVIDAYLGFEPGCNAANGWCDAPERAYADDTGCACRAAGPAPPGNAAWIAACAVAAAWGLRRRRAETASVAAALVLAWPASAKAEEAPPAVETPPSAIEANADVKAAVEPTLTDTPEKPWEPTLGIQGTFAGAYDNPALAGALGAHYRITPDWVVGLTAEYNPLLALNGETFRKGLFNGYATLWRRWPMRYEPVSLRTAIHAGTSVLLMDLVGAPAGSTGIFLGATPLGVQWRVTRSLNLMVDPVSLALPIPQLTGIPFAYGQYRTTIGAEIWVL